MQRLVLSPEERHRREEVLDKVEQLASSCRRTLIAQHNPVLAGLAFEESKESLLQSYEALRVLVEESLSQASKPSPMLAPARTAGKTSL